MASFGARVFKISRDEQGNRLTHMKITGGSLKVKSMLSNAGTLGQNGQKVTEQDVWEEKADQIRIYSGSKYVLTEEAEAGCVCAVKGLTHTWPGQALGSEKGVQQPLLQPVLTYTVLPEEDELEEELYVPQQSSRPVPKDHSLYGSWKEDRELEEIFNRTFGSKGERVIPSYHRISYGRSTRSEASAAATAAYREAHARPTGVQKDYLLVDGYNIIFAWDELKDLAKDNLDAARLKLMDMLCNYQGFTHCELICVFDAYKVKGGTGEVSMYHNIHVVYTKEAQTADAYIEKTSRELAQKHRVRVATSDALEQVIVMGHGAIRVSARELYEELEQIAGQMREYYRDKKEKFVNRPFEQQRNEQV